ncbi:MAG: glycosyltransferase [Pseudomonadales bacterium]
MICAIVVVFNPEGNFESCLASYCNSVDRVIVVDNSPLCNADRVSKVVNCTYLSLGGNQGIAKALNVGCEVACQLGGSAVLLMDQDSKFLPGGADALLGVYRDMSCEPSLAIVAPFRLDQVETKEGYKDRVITSGTVMKLGVYKEEGCFQENLFIDEVDFEYCYRLRRRGYKIFQTHLSVLQHRVGEPISVRIKGRTVKSMGHGYTRKYYIYRNRLIVRKQYPEFTERYLRSCFFDFFKMIRLERDRIRKSYFILKGIVHYFIGRTGKLLVKNQDD